MPGSKPGERRGGRQKGTPNKMTGVLKDTVLQALANVGGVAYLEGIAREHPAAFVGLIGRIIPVQVKDGGPEARVPVPVVHEHRP